MSDQDSPGYPLRCQGMKQGLLRLGAGPARIARAAARRCVAQPACCACAVLGSLTMGPISHFGGEGHQIICSAALPASPSWAMPPCIVDSGCRWLRTRAVVEGGAGRAAWRGVVWCGASWHGMACPAAAWRSSPPPAPPTHDDGAKQQEPVGELREGLPPATGHLAAQALIVGGAGGAHLL